MFSKSFDLFFHSLPVFTASADTISYAFIGGIFPALVWLWFWLHEDQHPEPIRLIVRTFLMGMLAVILVAPIEQIIANFFPSQSFQVYYFWAAAEEILKFLAAWVIALRSKAFDEPVDAFIYLTTAALGFAALENTFFTLTPLLHNDPIQSILTGNMRFIGASLLHIVTSGTLAIFIGLSYYKKPWLKRVATGVGLFLAITLHAIFNFFIMINEGSGTFIVFASVWVAIIIIIFSLEKIKSINYKTT